MLCELGLGLLLVFHRTADGMCSHRASEWQELGCDAKVTAACVATKLQCWHPPAGSTEVAFIVGNTDGHMKMDYTLSETRTRMYMNAVCRHVASVPVLTVRDAETGEWGLICDPPMTAWHSAHNTVTEINAARDRLYVPRHGGA